MTYAARYNPEVDAPTITRRNVKLQYSCVNAMPQPAIPCSQTDMVKIFFLPILTTI